MGTADVESSYNGEPAAAQTHAAGQIEQRRQAALKRRAEAEAKRKSVCDGGTGGGVGGAGGAGGANGQVAKRLRSIGSTSSTADTANTAPDTTAAPAPARAQQRCPVHGSALLVKRVHKAGPNKHRLFLTCMQSLTQTLTAVHRALSRRRRRPARVSMRDHRRGVRSLAILCTAYLCVRVQLHAECRHQARANRANSSSGPTVSSRTASTSGGRFSGPASSPGSTTAGGSSAARCPRPGSATFLSGRRGTHCPA